MVNAGLNDVLRASSHNLLGKKIKAGVHMLRTVSEKMHIVMCNISNVQRKSSETERSVVEANRMIKQLSEKLRYDVMET